MLVDEVGGQERRGHQEHGHLGGRQGVADLLTPFLARFDLSVVPDRDRVVAGDRAQHDLERFQPSCILLAVADEDLVALGRHNISLSP